jgi:hypothetical protein
MIGHVSTGELVQRAGDEATSQLEDHSRISPRIGGRRRKGEKEERRRGGEGRREKR